MNWINELLKRDYKYHVVYTFSNPAVSKGKGSINISLNRKIKTGATVNLVMEYIEKEHGLHDVIIENWIRLS